MNPNLALVMDPETGEVTESNRIAELEAEVAHFKQEAEDWKATAAEEARRASALRGQLTRMRGEQIENAKMGPRAERVHRLIDAWQKLCRHEGCAASDERFKVVDAALERRERVGMDMDQAEAELRKPLFGAKARPYLVGYEHKPEGKPSQRKDLIEYVLSDEKRITKFSGFAQDHAEYVLGAMVRPLVHTFGQQVRASRDPLTNEVEDWRSPCPLCEKDALVLQIAFSEDLQLVRLRCFEGCGRVEVRDRLRAMAMELRAAA